MKLIQTDIENIITEYVDKIEKKYPPSDNSQIVYKQSLKAMAGIDLGSHTNQDVQQIVETYLYTWGNMGRLLGREEFRGWQSRLTKELQYNHKMLEGLRKKRLETVNLSEFDADIKKCYKSFRDVVGRIASAKVLHLVSPDFFPIWDNAIAEGVRKELAAREDWTIEAFSPDDYYEFMKAIQQFTRKNSKVLSDLVLKYGKSKLRIIDECLLCAVRRPFSLFFGTM